MLMASARRLVRLETRLPGSIRPLVVTTWPVGNGRSLTCGAATGASVGTGPVRRTLNRGEPAAEASQGRREEDSDATCGPTQYHT
jgi:hypothetical protein